jgi:hypothetical protein
MNIFTYFYYEFCKKFWKGMLENGKLEDREGDIRSK